MSPVPGAYHHACWLPGGVRAADLDEAVLVAAARMVVDVCRTGMISGPHRAACQDRPRSLCQRLRGSCAASGGPAKGLIPSTRRRPCCPVWTDESKVAPPDRPGCPAAGAGAQSWPGCWSPGTTSCCSTNRPITTSRHRKAVEWPEDFLMDYKGALVFANGRPRVHGRITGRVQRAASAARNLFSAGDVQPVRRPL